MLSSNLNEEQKKSLQQILTTAEQKRNQKRSDAIEKSGGELGESPPVISYNVFSRRFPIHSASNSNELQLQQPTVELSFRRQHSHGHLELGS
jgi:hypothetical protein